MTTCWILLLVELWRMELEACDVPTFASGNPDDAPEPLLPLHAQSSSATTATGSARAALEVYRITPFPCGDVVEPVTYSAQATDSHARAFSVG